ncbi:hypothetical protein RMSM_04985 [Rhodopirellula maiorica SM1]|uniref:Uncharacterized protein n=1 Tax=Rhodopirellula maiorica SM1 TaxID=1265738 RepID=M5RG35_9BACT|nr:hypothetical protein RMSM_04985 [Rhodopirellula maiorica SM1]
MKLESAGDFQPQDFNNAFAVPVTAAAFCPANSMGHSIEFDNVADRKMQRNATNPCLKRRQHGR